MTNLTAAWHLAALSAQLRAGRLYPVTVAGVPLVLMRTAAGLGAMVDRCPHRNFPLSQGRMRGDALECPYHGWRFDKDGACVAVPGCELPVPNRLRATPVAVDERHGGIFVHVGAVAPPLILPPMPDADRHDHFWWAQGVWRGRVYDAIENVMDPFHTNFIHHGFIRRRDSRMPVKLQVNSFPRGIEMLIHQSRPDRGLMSRMLERKRTRSSTRYYPPTIVQARWESDAGLTLCVTAHFTPVDDAAFRPFACFSTPKGFAPAWMKELAIRTFLRPVIAQDRKALASQFDVIQRFGGPRYKEGPGDILGNRVQRLYAGETLGEDGDPVVDARL